jgi:phosphoribosylanthranilate isomerase
MFHVKICGVRQAEEIEFAAGFGADAVGLNFFPPSIRFLDPEVRATQALSDLAMRLGLYRVGVVVNRSADSIARLCEVVGLDAIQLHGDESMDDLQQIRGVVSLPIIRAIKLPRHAIQVPDLQARVAPWSEANCHLLLDADAGKEHGGSGKTLDWDSVAAWSQSYPGSSWTLAGGLSPDNVARAVETTGATSVDTASGVERPRGTKNATLTERFCRATGLI